MFESQIKFLVTFHLKRNLHWKSCRNWWEGTRFVSGFFMWKKSSRPSIRKMSCRRWYSELGPFLTLFRIFAHETQTLQRAGCQGAHIDSFPSRAQGLAFFPSIRGQELKFYPYLDVYHCASWIRKSLLPINYIQWIKEWTIVHFVRMIRLG